MKKNREIDFVEFLMGDNYRSLEISLVRGFLVDKVKREIYCVFFIGLCKKRCIMFLSIKFKEK